MLVDAEGGIRGSLSGGCVEGAVLEACQEALETGTSTLLHFGVSSVDVPVSRRSEEHTSELQSRGHLVCRLLLEKKKETYRKENPRNHRHADADEEMRRWQR